MLRGKTGFLFLLVVLGTFLIAGNPKLIVSDPPQLKVNGMVTVDGVPTRSEIRINSILKNDKSIFPVNANENDGLFTIKLPRGDVYELVIGVAQFPPQVIELNTTELDSAFTINTYADFISPGYDEKLKQLKRELMNGGTLAYDKAAFENSYGAMAKEGLSYKVQIGAFRFIENFNYSAVIGLPKIIRQTDKDAITRFMMGNYSTYNQAKDLLNTLHKNSVNDAFIIATFNGEKKYLQQLIDEKILY